MAANHDLYGADHHRCGLDRRGDLPLPDVLELNLTVSELSERQAAYALLDL
jgi:hypothetical protein